jgi:hypothetical protein
MKLCLTVLTALLFCALTTSVSIAEDKAEKSQKPDQSARDEAVKNVDKTETADKAAAKDKAAKSDKTAKTDKTAKADAAKKPKALKGKVVKVDGDKLVLATGNKKEPKEVTVTADADTKVMIEGKAAKLADLKEGQQVTITPAEGTAQAIVVAAPKPKKEATDKPAKGAGDKNEKKAEKIEKTEKAAK